MNKKIIFLIRVLYSVFFVIITGASMAPAMMQDYVTIMIADAQDGQSVNESERGILKRENSETKKKKAVTWADTHSTIPNSANTMISEKEARQNAGQELENKSEEKEPGCLNNLELQPTSRKQETDPWHLQAPNMVDMLLSDTEQSTLYFVGLEKHHCIEAFLDLWPTQKRFQESAVGDSDGGDSSEAVKYNRQVPFLTALAAQQNKKNDQRLAEINSKRARLKPYGYILWPVAVIAVSFLEVVIARVFGCPG